MQVAFIVSIIFCGIVVCKLLLTVVWTCLIQYLTALAEAKVLKQLNLTYFYQRNVKNIF
jgi:hypothetical protein